MNTLRQKIAVAVLTLLVSVTAFAGQIQSPGVTSGSPTTSSVTNITTTVTTTIIVTMANAAN